MQYFVVMTSLICDSKGRRVRNVQINLKTMRKSEGGKDARQVELCREASGRVGVSIM
jgi:hypothetical protein